MAFIDSTAMVMKIRSTVARADPGTSLHHIVTAALAHARRDGANPQPDAAFADAVVRSGSKYVIAPLGLKVRVVAELAVHCAIDAIAFIEGLRFTQGASFEGAEKHLRGLANAVASLEVLVRAVPSWGFTQRLLQQPDLTPAKIAAILEDVPLMLFLFQLAERERPVARSSGAVVWDEQRTLSAMIDLCAAAAIDRSRRDGVLRSLTWIHTIAGSMKFDDIGNGSLKPVLQVLNADPRILTELVTRGLREIESVAREAYAQRDVDEARCIVEAATPLWFALEESSQGVAPGGPTRLHAVLRTTGIDDAFQLADSVQWGDLLACARDALGDPERAQNVIGRFVYMINDPQVSADAPGFWDEVIRRCERAGFTLVRSTVRALLDAAVIPADSTIVSHARAMCSTVSAAAIEPEVVDGFIEHLKMLAAARTACRYAPQTPAETLETGILVQLSGIVVEVYQRLPGSMQRTFRKRLATLAKDGNVPANDRNVLLEACAALDAFCEREQSHNNIACEQRRRRPPKRQAKEQSKEL